MEPREGLPPCQSFAAMDGRMASLIDKSACDKSHGMRERFLVIAGTDDGAATRAYHLENQTGNRVFGWTVLTLETDDADEAAAAFERGREYVRTGVLE